MPITQETRRTKKRWSITQHHTLEKVETERFGTVWKLIDDSPEQLPFTIEVRPHYNRHIAEVNITLDATVRPGHARNHAFDLHTAANLADLVQEIIDREEEL